MQRRCPGNVYDTGTGSCKKGTQKGVDQGGLGSPESDLRPGRDPSDRLSLEEIVVRWYRRTNKGRTDTIHNEIHKRITDKGGGRGDLTFEQVVVRSRGGCHKPYVIYKLFINDLFICLSN